MNIVTFLKNTFSLNTETKEALMKKFLIVGLGNIGAEYANTRHNIGFKIVEEVAEVHKTTFETEKLGDVATFRLKGRTFILLKPSTYHEFEWESSKILDG